MINLLTDNANALKALVDMEGERWLERQKKGEFKGYSVFDAMKELETLGNFRSAESKLQTVIYGDDGWNRYAVRCNGEVLFIVAAEGRKGDAEKAARLGFTLL